MSNTITEPRTFIIKNVEINYAKLAAPVSPFGISQYEVQITTTDSSLATHLKENFINVKEKDGKFVASLKRKAIKASGDDNGPVKVFDSQLQVIEKDRLSKIGNGSTGNIKLFQYPYDVNGKKGVAGSLTAIQITNFVEYTGGGNSTDGFDIVGDPMDSTVEDSGSVGF